MSDGEYLPGMTRIPRLQDLSKQLNDSDNFPKSKYQIAGENLLAGHAELKQDEHNFN